MCCCSTSYLLKTAAADDVIAAVRDAAAGTASLSPELLTRLTQALRRPPPPDPLQLLSPRERDVLRLIAQGHSNRQIARDLAIGEQTVRTHVRGVLTKLGLQDRVHGRDLRPPPPVTPSNLRPRASAATQCASAAHSDANAAAAPGMQPTAALPQIIAHLG